MNLILYFLVNVLILSAVLLSINLSDQFSYSKLKNLRIINVDEIHMLLSFISISIRAKNRLDFYIVKL